MDWRERIVSDADVCHGEPCVRGTRVSVSIVVATLADMSVDEVLKAFPQLKRDDVRACLLYAAEASHNTLVHDMGFLVKIDEQLSELLGGPLQRHGYEVRTVIGQKWGGFKDHQLWPLVIGEGTYCVYGGQGARRHPSKAG
jgi:uncharacterized protein (DUF433 family)